jgi:hypothetical protein
MRDCNGSDREGDRWVMVDHDAQRVLFRLADVGNESDILRLGRELPALPVVVEIALPALPALRRDAREASIKLETHPDERPYGDR